jgi:DeoR/GlpR family transcriptional regulator of sugar metabolism
MEVAFPFVVNLHQTCDIVTSPEGPCSPDSVNNPSRFEIVISAQKRRQAIIEKLQTTSDVAFADLAEEFGVSVMTVRRDVDYLERDGLVRKVLGGAMSLATREFEPAFATRVAVAAAEKVFLADALVNMLLPGQTVILDSGSTVLAVAKSIRGRNLGLTIITSSLLAALELVDEPDTDVILAGGHLRAGEVSLVGPEAELILSWYKADVFIMGVAGVDAIRGVTDYHPGEAAVKRAAMAAANRTIVVADLSKLSTTHLASIAPLNKIAAIVTDGDPAEPTMVAAAAAGVDVVCVPMYGTQYSAVTQR